MPTRFANAFESLLAIATGSFGFFAAIHPWQEQLEWVGRILLVLLSIVSVGLGIFVALRSLRKP